MANRTKQRRDSKHRVLRRGESIRDNGKYQFKYHVDGKPHFVYSWRLEPTDPQPVGKKPCLSLRELEKQIGYDLDCPRWQCTGNTASTIWFIVTMKSTEFRSRTSRRTFAATPTAATWPALA